MARTTSKSATERDLPPHLLEALKKSTTLTKRKRNPEPVQASPSLADDNEGSVNEQSEGDSESEDEEQDVGTSDEESESSTSAEEVVEDKAKPQSKRERKAESRKPASRIKEDNGDEDDDDDAIEDEPALSHAEKRRQRKREQNLQKQQQEPDNLQPSKKQKLQDGSAKSLNPAPGGRQNSVWVGNLSYKTTVDDLKKFFEGCGAITRVNMPMRIPNNSGGPTRTGPMQKGENRGFAFVDFASPDSKLVAISLSERPLIGRKLLIKDGVDFTGRPAPESGSTPAVPQTHSKTAQKILKVQKQPPAPTLFLGNLGFETTEADIKMLFEAHRAPHSQKTEEKPQDSTAGKAGDDWLKKVRMGTFEDSGMCKGFAFVDFASTEAATSVLINPKNHRLNGRQLVVEYASIDAVKRGASKHLVAGEQGTTKSGTKASDSFRGKTYTRNPMTQEGAAETKDQNTTDKSINEKDNKNEHDAPKNLQRSSGNEEKRRKVGGGPRIGGGQKGPKHRPKPGAALASAKRESAAIMPSQGQKIKFGV